MAQFHADREFVGHPDELQIKEAAKEVRGLIHKEAGEVTARFFVNAVSRLRQADVESVQQSELLQLCERCATSDPAKWLTLANDLRSALTPDIVRDYFRKAVQADPSDASAWKKWAMFERESGDELQSLYKNIRAIEVGGGDLAFCGRVAADLLRLMREPEMKDRFPPHRRSALSGALRHQLTQHHAAGRLDADALGKLGWLYLNDYSPQSDPEMKYVKKAKAYAEQALKLDDGNTHCMNLFERCEQTLAYDV